jgi:hypothetical protein
MLTIITSGNGGGTVVSAPAGINCAPDCSVPYNFGTVVTLTATPDATSTFSGWVGACSGTGPCMVTMNADMNATATFTRNQVALSVAKSGNGSGTVTSNPLGINCGTDCTFGFLAGTVVTLTAMPAAGSVFTGWSGGGCSGTATCTVTITTATSVVASFASRFTITVTILDGSDISVRSTPAAINCPGACTASFGIGAQVTLTATDGLHCQFAGWSGGGCSGTGPCAVTVNANMSIDATGNCVTAR